MRSKKRIRVLDIVGREVTAGCFPPLMVIIPFDLDVELTSKWNLFYIMTLKVMAIFRDTESVF